MSKVGPDGIALIKKFEGCARKRPDGRFDAYPDPATGGAPWTIGWGSTGDDIVRGTIWTQEQCDARLALKSAYFAARVTALLGAARTNQHQFDAMVALIYNIGEGNFAASTLLKLHIKGDFAGAGAQFGRWNKAAGQVMGGLTTRRASEARLYLTPDNKPAPSL